jgi:hypothetical protein
MANGQGVAHSAPVTSAATEDVVTGGKCPTHDALASRNGGPEADLEALGKMQASGWVLTDEMRREWESEKARERCEECNRDIRDATVWRVRVRRGRSSRPLRELCEDCGRRCVEENRYGVFAQVGREEPCEVCGRPVVNTGNHCNYWRSYRTYCSYRCAKRAEVERARERRRAERERCGDSTCADCGEQFTPRRLDSTYCSNACRQRAYRRRKAAA